MKIKSELENVVSNSLANFGGRATTNRCTIGILFWWGGEDTVQCLRDCTMSPKNQGNCVKGAYFSRVFPRDTVSVTLNLNLFVIVILCTILLIYFLVVFRYYSNSSDLTLRGSEFLTSAVLDGNVEL